LIKIFTDSTSYIPKDIQLEYDISILPLSVNVGGKEYIETQISNDSFYEMIKRNNKPAKSSPPNLDVIVEAFEEDIKNNNQILGVFITSFASETYKLACKAKEILLKKYTRANITIIDSMSTSMQLGLAVLAAAEASKRGAWLEDVVKSVDETMKRTRFLFIPATLKYLEINGRIGKAKALVGNLMKMIPLLTTSGGQIAPFETIRTYQKAIDRMVEVLKSDMDKYGIERVVVTHIDAIDEATTLVNRLKEISGVDVAISDVGPVVGGNVGPGTIGFVYKTIQEMPIAG